jgi:flavin-binding protein dodecin
MSDHSYGLTEIVGTSTVGVDEAMKNAIQQAKSMLPNLDWFELVAVRGHLVDGGIAHVQVTIKVGHRF